MSVKENQECAFSVFNALLVSSSRLSSKKGRGKKTISERRLLSLWFLLIPKVWDISCWSASGRNVWHEVKLVLSEPELRQLIGSVQTQLDHQRHEYLFVNGVKVNNSTCSRSLGRHADPHTNAPTAEASRGPQKRAGCAKWRAAVALLSSTGRRVAVGDPRGEVLVVRVELLQLHAGYEVRTRL